MKPEDAVLLIASAAALYLVLKARAGSSALSQAQQNAERYGGTVQGWSGYTYIDNDPVPGISIPGKLF